MYKSRWWKDRGKSILFIYLFIKTNLYLEYVGRVKEETTIYNWKSPHNFLPWVQYDMLLIVYGLYHFFPLFFLSNTLKYRSFKILKVGSKYFLNITYYKILEFKWIKVPPWHYLASPLVVDIDN